jgi:hypothetical protein
VSGKRLVAAREFVYREARLVEQRLLATLFEGAPPQGVVDAVRAYRNADGGFGHGLEPDKRCPDSQPLDVAFALDTLAAAGAREPHLAARACDFPDGVADPDGAVASVLRRSPGTRARSTGATASSRRRRSGPRPSRAAAMSSACATPGSTASPNAASPSSRGRCPTTRTSSSRR